MNAVQPAAEAGGHGSEKTAVGSVQDVHPYDPPVMGRT